MGDQPVTRPLPTHRTTQTQNKRIHNADIHALSGIRAHDPSVRANEDSSCLRLSGHCDRQRNDDGAGKICVIWNYIYVSSGRSA
jgi:hypothetical protein